MVDRSEFISGCGRLDLELVVRENVSEDIYCRQEVARRYLHADDDLASEGGWGVLPIGTHDAGTWDIRPASSLISSAHGGHGKDGANLSTDSDEEGEEL